MFKFFFKFLFFGSVLFALSSESLFFLWVCFEYNMMLFIPMFSKYSNSMYNSMMKYFIIQSLSSSLFLIFLIYFSSVKSGSVNFNLLVLISMWIKMGLFPFNSWFFQISENMDWMMWFLLNTFQKVIPLWVLSNCYIDILYMNMVILLNSVYSFIEIWNQTSIRWIMNSSSLNHFSWMLVGMNSYLASVWEIYFISYLVVFYYLFLFMKVANWGSLFNFFSSQKVYGINFMLIMLNFLGVPPFLGFLPKLLIIYYSKLSMIFVILFFVNMVIGSIYFMNILLLMCNQLHSKLSMVINKSNLFIYSSMLLIFIMLNNFM